MQKLLKDVRSLLEASPQLSYIHKAGGILVITDFAQVNTQMKTPYIVVEDGSDANIQHMSSRVVRRTMGVVIHCVQRIFEKTEIILGSNYERGVDEIANDVKSVLDMDRMNGLYAQAFWDGSDQSTPVGNENIHLVEKALKFSYVRIES